VALAASLIACKTEPIVPETLTPKPLPALTRADIPDYADLVERYNANAPSLPRLWARTDVEMRWRDDKGKARRESGDGRLIFERPLHTAWTLEVLGDIKLWAGSDEKAFWLFDRVEDSTAYYGSYAKPLARPLPLPVQPEAVPYLLGLVRLDPDRRPTPPEVELFDGYFIIEPPGLNLRLMLDPRDARPVRIDLTDDQGVSQATCLLKGAVDVQSPTGPTVLLPESAELYPVGQESRLTLTLKRPTTDEEKVQSRLFNFELLSNTFNPDEVINLNEAAE
jgi:hypothetical protein